LGGSGGKATLRTVFEEPKISPFYYQKCNL